MASNHNDQSLYIDNLLVTVFEKNLSTLTAS